MREDAVNLLFTNFTKLNSGRSSQDQIGFSTFTDKSEFLSTENFCYKFPLHSHKTFPICLQISTKNTILWCRIQLREEEKEKKNQIFCLRSLCGARAFNKRKIMEKSGSNGKYREACCLLGFWVGKERRDESCFASSANFQSFLR